MNNSNKKLTDKQKKARKKGRNTKKQYINFINISFEKVFNKLEELQDRCALLEGQMELYMKGENK
jgi:hypothetical protein